MAYHVARASEQQFAPVEGAPGFEAAVLVGPGIGSVHMELALCRLAPGASTPPLRHPFEESWYVLSGSGSASTAHVSYAVSEASFGMTPVTAPERKTAGDEGMTWLRMRTPQAQAADPQHGEIPADDWTPSTELLTPDETDPRSMWAGQFRDEDMPPHGPIGMPGYHGPNIKSISIRMLIDELLGATQHTHFMVEFGSRDPNAQYALEHYHPFEEAYHLLTGSAHGILDGEHVDISAGDTVWTGVGATHGFYTTSEEPLRWLEVQTPKPPTQHAMYFPRDWSGLAGS
ncbi:MAG: cupin domain-containing protein [Actinomycetales bacterium]|nr:cupin domain-containing protein [Actinomycetales bacterium]